MRSWRDELISKPAPPRSPAPLDADLVEAALADSGAFAAIYDRYADRLHDFCHSVLRDRDEAADAVHDALLTAARSLQKLRDPSRLRPWLYAIARNESLRRVRSRARVIPTEEPPEAPEAGRGPEGDAEREEIVALVWEAAGGLEARDRALLDLSVRQGLDGQELADSLGVRRDHVYVLLSNMRRRMERSLGVLLVARGTRRNCPELREMLADWGGRLEPRMRKRVARHIDGCAKCGEQRTRLVNPAALLAAVPALPAPAMLRESFVSALAGSAGAGATGAAAGAATGGASVPSSAGTTPLVNGSAATAAQPAGGAGGGAAGGAVGSAAGGAAGHGGAIVASVGANAAAVGGVKAAILVGVLAVAGVAGVAQTLSDSDSGSSADAPGPVAASAGETPAAGVGPRSDGGETEHSPEGSAPPAGMTVMESAYCKMAGQVVGSGAMGEWGSSSDGVAGDHFEGLAGAFTVLDMAPPAGVAEATHDLASTYLLLETYFDEHGSTDAAETMSPPVTKSELARQESDWLSWVSTHCTP